MGEMMMGFAILVCTATIYIWIRNLESWLFREIEK